jgi:hypothetical protein
MPSAEDHSLRQLERQRATSAWQAMGRKGPLEEGAWELEGQ